MDTPQKLPPSTHSVPWGPATYLGITHGLNGAVVGRAEGGEVDQHVYLRVLLHGISHVLEDGDQDLLVTPVKLLLVVPTVRKAEGGQDNLSALGRGKSRGGASSGRWKGRVLPSVCYLPDKISQEWGLP